MTDAPLDPPADEVPPPCAHCGRPATRELTANTFACSAACERIIAEQWCSSCGADYAAGEDHADACDADYNAERRAS